VVEGVFFFAFYPLDGLIGKAGEALIVDEVGSDFEVAFDRASGVSGLTGFVLIGGHDAVIEVAGVSLFIGVESRWDVGVAAFEPGEDAKVERGGDAVEVVKAFVEWHVFYGF